MEAQFGYWPLDWIFYGRVLNRKISHLPERLLRIVYRESINLKRSFFHYSPQKYMKSGYRAIQNKIKSFK